MRVALATAAGVPDAAAEDGPLLAALHERGHEAVTLVWDDPDAPWEDQDIVVVRTTWDYQDDRDAFVAWAQRVAAVTRLENPADVLRWNTHKGYLLELEERGAPIVPTAWLARGDRVELASLASQRGWEDVVLKPAVGASGQGVVRTDAASGGAALDRLLEHHDVLVQPYLPAIERIGELSIVLFDHEVSHVVRKRPRPDGFLVQVEHGGTEQLEVDPPRDAVDLARWVVDATGTALLYARVDLVADEAGAWQLAELEATEPGLFLGLSASGTHRFADAIAARRTAGAR